MQHCAIWVHKRRSWNKTTSVKFVAPKQCVSQLGANTGLSFIHFDLRFDESLLGNVLNKARPKIFRIVLMFVVFFIFRLLANIFYPKLCQCNWHQLLSVFLINFFQLFLSYFTIRILHQPSQLSD